MNTTVALRPLHAWFFHWERVVPSRYRVVARGLAALASALLLLRGFHPLLAAPVSLAAWIGLAVAQDHDQRTRLPPDQAFVAALTVAVSAPPLALAIGNAHGPSRASSNVPPSSPRSHGPNGPRDIVPGVVRDGAGAAP